MKKAAFIILSLILFAACNLHSSNFEITGKINGSSDQWLILSELTEKNYVKVDSVQINKDGEFKVTGKTDFPSFFQLSVSTNQFIILIVRPGDKIILKSEINHFGNNYSVAGSEDSKLIQEYNSKNFFYQMKVDSLQNIYNVNQGNPNLFIIENMLNKAYDSLRTALRNYSIRFIGVNSRSLASIIPLYSNFTANDNLFDVKSDYQYFNSVDSILFKLYPQSYTVKALHNHLSQVKETMDLEANLNNRIAIGAQAPDIALPSPGGATIALSSLRGKYVLLDFWASWCGPCRSENPNLVSNYNKYKSKDFEIFQVSLDQKRESWVAAIQNDKLAWIHVSDLGYWNSSVVPVYGIQSIPANFLLDKEGKIIAKNLRGEDLGRKLTEIFGY